MTKKIFRSIIVVSVLVLFSSFVIATGFLYNYFNNSEKERLKEELKLVSQNVEKIGVGYFDNFESSIFRFTLINSDGTVLYDSRADAAAQMENHSDREEIKEAFSLGFGSSTRYSETLTKKTIYEAVLLNDGTVLRISADQLTVGALVIAMLPAICLIIFVCVLVTMLLSYNMANSIVKPLNNLDLEKPVLDSQYDELTPVFTKLNKQHRQIEKQLSEIRKNAEEFAQITSSMQEGLVILDKKGVVISINPAAKMIFSTDDSHIGKDFLTVDRSLCMSRAVETALSGSHTEFREERGGKEYQFIINCTRSEGEVSGVVILCIDVSETAFAEQSRREFTANVSHELKTPLQAIIGSAELLESGLAKHEDRQKFVSNIKKEATRLVTLINDIIRLSQLDESYGEKAEDVDLCGVCAEVITELREIAAKRSITFEFSAPDSLVIGGVRQYLYQIVYNLCDNAVRYNKDGGEVKVSLEKREDEITLSVADSGVGIAAEHQGRIFERFWRVDKSHSKETGGTGLGLSIVKHAVLFHNGKIKVQSEPGVGTTFTVTLPLKK